MIFLHWDFDIDLEALLGDYTCSEDDNPSGKEKTSKKSIIKDGKYMCTECEKTYSSISGIRGHMTSKHGYTSVRASDFLYNQADSKKGSKVHQSKSTRNDQAQVFSRKAEDVFFVSESDFNIIFNKILPLSLKNIIDCPFRNSEKSVNGKNIVVLATMLSESNIEAIQSILQPEFLKIFNKMSDAQLNTKEMLFQAFNSSAFKMMPTLTEHIRSIYPDIELPVRQFVGVLLYQLMEDLIDNRASLYQKKSEKTTESISDNDQSVLFYISGYIIRAIEKKLLKKVEFCEEEIKIMSQMLRRETDSEKTFVEKHSKWTEKVSRGGLKIPSDNMFLLVRECEICCRKHVDDDKLNKNSYKKDLLKEKLTSDYMINYYAEKICPGKFCSRFLESVVTLYISIRGFSTATRARNDIMESKKSIRQVLKQKSENDMY